jgi:beta-lactamase superfamily II metal-dependent hydrolase
MDTLRVRIYNVRFGDAVLITVPDRAANGTTETRHILIDVGNVLQGEGGQDVVFRPVIDDILHELDGRPLDLYVMTHEHMDHVQGLLYAEQTFFSPGATLRDRLQVRHAWLTASAEPGYYDRHDRARQQLDEARDMYQAIERFVQAAPDRATSWVQVLMLNNNPRATADCVDYLRELAQHTWYVYRGLDLEGKHPFQEARLDIWAPEEDTSVYYGAFHPLELGVTPGTGSRGKPALTVPIPLAGVDAGTFYNLVEMRRWGYADNLLAIDRAANNTSVVFCLTWRGWRLLFPGDAEHRSWQTMSGPVTFEPIHFLKISHHGSHNGMPPDDLLNGLLPEGASKQRHAALSTYPNTYNHVPDDGTLAVLEHRCTVHSVVGMPDGGALDIEFPADEGSQPGDVTAHQRDIRAP